MTTRLIGLFATCLIDALAPRIGFSVVKLLQNAGFEVEVPQAQTCCGQPAFNSGMRSVAFDLAQKWLREFESYDYIVIPSGSCAGMVKQHYAELFSSHTDLLVRYQALQPRIYELCDFLVNIAKIATVPGKLTGSITYHDSCSGLRELGIKQQPRDLIALMPDVELKEMNGCERCCGFGGTFSIKYSEISAAIVDDKCRDIVQSGAQAVVLGDLGCMLNIEGRLKRNGQDTVKVWHIAELLAGDVDAS